MPLGTVTVLSRLGTLLVPDSVHRDARQTAPFVLERDSRTLPDSGRFVPKRDNRVLSRGLCDFLVYEEEKERPESRPAGSSPPPTTAGALHGGDHLDALDLLRHITLVGLSSMVGRESEAPHSGDKL